MPLRSLNFFQMSDDVVYQAQCVAAVVGHFHWQKIAVIYEEKEGFFNGPGAVISLLSDLLRSANSEIEQHWPFPALSALSDRENAVEVTLRKLEGCSTRVFILLQFSLESAVPLFQKAKRMGMMEKGYVWIIADEIANLLDAVDASAKLNNMQGVIGIRTRFPDGTTTAKSFRKFKNNFRRAYGSQYPEEDDENSNPSIFALRAYDAISSIAQALGGDNSQYSLGKKLSENLASIEFRGKSGLVKFKSNGMLEQPPRFEIFNVVSKSYREIALWSPQTKSNGFVIGSTMNIGPIFWPGGLEKVPKGWSWTDVEKPRLRIGVPAGGAFNQFVRVSYDDRGRNETSVTGFSIDVFKQVEKLLPYKLHYKFVPVNGAYDEMVQRVFCKVRIICCTSSL